MTSVSGMEHCTGETAACASCGIERVLYEFDGRVLGDRPAHRSSGEAVDHRGQIQELTVPHGK